MKEERFVGRIGNADLYETVEKPNDEELVQLMKVAIKLLERFNELTEQAIEAKVRREK